MGNGKDNKNGECPKTDGKRFLVYFLAYFKKYGKYDVEESSIHHTLVSLVSP